MATFKGLPFKEYQELEGINKSSLDLINKAPALLKWSKECPEDKDGKNAGIFGNAFHTIVLEPEKFEERYCVALKCDKRTIDGKAEYKAFIDEVKGKKLIILDQKEIHKLKLMQGSVMAHPEARSLIEASEKEVSFHCEREGYWTKSRHDGIVKSRHVSFDLKSLDPGNREFDKAWGTAVAKRRYDVQAAHYEEDYKHEFGVGLRAFYFIVVSKSLSLGRYECRVMKLSTEQKDQGREDREKNIKRYLSCSESNKWPGIETTVIPAYTQRS